MLDTVLSPFQMAGRFTLGLIRLAISIPLGIYRVCDSGFRSALIMAMVLALAHVGIGVLAGRPDLPHRVFEGAVIGALVGVVYGVYRALTRPRTAALPTPAVFRPRWSQRLPRVFGYLSRAVALRVMLLMFFAVAISFGTIELADIHGAAADPNPPTATPVDLSVIDSGPPALTLVGAEAAAADGFRLEARPVLLASLAKLYADPRFPQVVPARAVFHNAAGAPVTDYRVRFRLTDYAADWSPWSNSAPVRPQETVTTPYFPLLDEARLAQLQGFALVDLQVEYEYRRPDGQLIQHQEIRRVKLMARNWMAFWHSVPEDQQEAMMQDPTSQPWREAYATMPLLLPAFVTKDDPVIQQVAGWVSAQAGGAPDNDAGARRFMQALYEFMVANGIRYQLPAGGEREGWAVQHVHYGRDVLRNHAGCCIDLTIFYASVCEAVGLEPVLILVPGHIFPAIRLPDSKELVPVEVTMVNSSRPQDGLDYLVSGYAFAVAVGQFELTSHRQGAHFEVDIVAQRRAGVQGIALPPVPADVLAGWNIHPVAPTAPWQTLAYWALVVSGLFLVRRVWRQWRLARQLRSADPQVRFEAVAALAQMSSGWSARLLTRTLADGNEDVRRAAEAALEARGERVTVAPGLRHRPTGLPSLGASRRALLALAAGQFDSFVLAEPAPVAERPAPPRSAAP